MKSPPLTWTLATAALGRTPQSYSLEATAAELDALKRYADVEDLISFKADIKVATTSGTRVRVSGRLRADVIQASVLTLDAVSSALDEPFTVEFWPEDQILESESSDFDADQPEPIVDDKLPIGAFLCELFVVSLDPYPQNEGDTFEWGPQPEERDANPFAELERIRRAKGDAGTT